MSVPNDREWMARDVMEDASQAKNLPTVFNTYPGKPSNLHEKACCRIAEFPHCKLSCIEHSDSLLPYLKIQWFFDKLKKTGSKCTSHFASKQNELYRRKKIIFLTPVLTLTHPLMLWRLNIPVQDKFSAILCICTINCYKQKTARQRLAAAFKSTPKYIPHNALHSY